MDSSKLSSRSSANACASRRSDSDSGSVLLAVSANGVAPSLKEMARSADAVVAGASPIASAKGFCSD